MSADVHTYTTEPDESELNDAIARIKAMFPQRMPLTDAQEAIVPEAAGLQYAHEMSRLKDEGGVPAPDNAQSVSIGNFSYTLKSGSLDNRLTPASMCPRAYALLMNAGFVRGGEMRMIAALFRQTASIRRYMGRGETDDEFAPAETVNCRAETCSVRVRTAEGTEKTASVRLFVPAVDASGNEIAPYPPQSLVTVEGYAGTYSVLQCAVMRGFTAHHMELMLS